MKNTRNTTLQKTALMEKDRKNAGSADDTEPTSNDTA